ncbi:MAG: MBG domain-containing protein [Clostridia bacterium]|nr:MBG domain-containing protein [Clostridia bacterium]
MGAYSAGATFTFDSVNYKLVKGGAEVNDLSCDITVVPKSLDLSGVTYDGATDENGVPYDGETHKIAAGNIPEGVTGVSYEYFEGNNSLGANGVKNAGEYKVVVTFALSDNYGGGTTTHEVKIKINKAVLTVKVNGSVISYGDEAKNDGVTISGLLGSDTAAILSLTYTYTKDGAAYRRGDDAGEYVISVTSAEPQNYTLSVETGILTVKPREITVSWKNGENDNNTSFEYVYSEGTVWTPYAYVTNAYGTDNLKLVVSGGREDAAMNCTATVVGIEGEKAHNYKLPTVEAKRTFNVLPAPRTGVIVWEEAEFVYNGQAQAPKAYYFENETDRIPKELSVSTNRSAVNVGHYTATASLGSNYDLKGETTKEFDIIARKVYVEILDASVRYSANIDFGVLDWTTFDGSYGFVSGDVCNISLNAAVNGVGKCKIEGSYSFNNTATAANYKVIFVGNHVDGDGGVLTVTRGKYDMSNVTFAGTEVTYDGQAHNVTVLGLPEGLTATVTYSKDGISYAAGEVINAGKYTVEIKYSGDFANYEAEAATTITLEIKKAALTVKANNSEIVYGDEPKANGVTYSGFVNGEDETQAGIIFGTLLYTYTYTRYGNAGTYSVKPTEGCLSSDNYDIIYAAGSLTVKPRELTVEWYADGDKTSTTLKYVYDGLSHAPVAVIASGVVNGDVVTVTVKGAQTEIGENYTATAVSGNANYVVAASCEKVAFGIIPAEKYTLVWDHTELVYNGEVRKPNAYYYDADGERQTIADGDISLSGAGINAGKYTASVNVTVDGHVLIGSYEYEIVAASVTVTITNDKTVKYGEKAIFGAADWRITEGQLFNGDDLNVTLKTTADERSNVGAYAITAVYGNGNYKVTFINGTLNVIKADVDESGIVFDNVNQTYAYNGEQRSAKIVSLPKGVTGVRYEYKDAAGKVVSAEGVKNAGVYTVTAIFTVDGNYNAVAGTYSTTITITAKELSGITLTGGTVTYDGIAQVPALSGDFTAITDVVYTYVKGGNKVANAVNAGTYTVTVVLTIDSNYDASKVSGAVYDAVKHTLTLTTTLVIEKAELTATAHDGVTEYGTAANANGYGYTLRGFVNGESETVITVKNVIYGYATGKNVVGTAAGAYADEITVTLVIDAENYVMSANNESGKLTVTPKTITVEWQAGEGGEVLDGKFVHKYDGKDYAPVAIAKDENGAIAGLTLTVSGKQSALGDNYTARVTALLGGNGNYALPLEEQVAQFRIISEKEEIRDGKVIWDNTEHEYDGKPYKPTAYFYVGETKHEIPSELITVEGGSAVDVGTYIAKVPATVDGVSLDSESTEMSFEIKKRTVYIVIGDATTYYGTPVNLGAVSLGYRAGSATFLNSDYKIEVTCEATVTSPIGTYKLAGRFISNDASNYNVVFCGSWASPDADNGRFGTLTIERAVYDTSKITFMDTEVTYDGLFHKVTLNGLPSGLTADNYECIYTSTQGFGGGAEGVKGAGVYNVTVKFKNLDPNYELISDMHTTLEIKKAALTVKANDSEVIYGEEPLTAGVDWANAGFKNGETESVLGGELKYSYTYTRGASVGDYVIKVSGLTSANYEITYLAGTMKVIPRTVTVSWYYDETLGTQALTYVYDGNAHKPVAVAGNLVAGDVATIEVSGERIEIGVNFTATAASISNPNYKLPEDGSEKASFSVMPIDEKYIIWNYSELTYNGTLQMPHVYYLDENGNEVSLDEYRTVTRNNGISAGEHTVEIPTTKYIELGLRGNATYNYKIEKAKLTVKINNSFIKFKDAVTFNGYLVEGTVFGNDNLGIVLDTNATSASSVGEYEITATYSNENYDVTFVYGTLTIEKADVAESDIEFDNANKEYEYDGTLRGAQIKVLPEGVTGVRYEYLDASGKVVSADGVKDVGVYTVRAIFTVDGNHNEVKGIHTTTITITKAAINISNVVFDEQKTLGYTGEKQEVFVSGTAIGVSGVNYTYYVYDANAAEGLGAKLSSAPVNAGKYVVVAEFVAMDNYTADDVKLTMLLTVEKAALTVTVNDKTLVYGTAADANGYGYVVQGLLGGDKGNENAVLGGWTLAYAQAQHENAGTYDIVTEWNGVQAASFETDNYIVTVTNGTLTVTKYVITSADVEWTNAAGDTTKTFIYEEDGSEHAPYANVNISGITLTVSGGASVAGKYVATVTGVDNANYEVEANITRTFEIVATMPEIVWTDTQFVYDGQPHVPTATLADGSAVTETVTVVEGSAVDKGIYTAEIVYNGNTYTTTFEITARKVYIVIDEVTTTYKTAPDFTGAGRYLYGDADKQFVGIDIDDVLTYRSSVPATAPVGSYADMISARYTGSDNYEVTITAGTLRILKAQYDMSGVKLSSYSVDYDGKPHAAEVVGCPAGVTPHISYYTSASGWSFDQNGVVAAGVYAVKVTFTSDDDNYEPIPDKTGTMEIRKATLTVKANDNSIVYGDEPEANGVTYAGFVNGEDVSVLGGTLGYSFNYNRNGAAGTYAITPEGYTSANYEIKFVSGVLTVEKRVVTVNWYKDSLLTGAALQYTYDGVTEFKPYAVAGNVISGDSVTLTVSGGQRAAGLQYRATVTRISNGNYALPEDGSASVSFDVLPRAYEIVWENTEFIYDPLKKQAPGAYFFDENGQKIALTVTILGGKYNVDAGTYTAMVTGAPNGVSLGDLGGEFAKMFEIKPKDITIKINSVKATYKNLPSFDITNWTYVGENRITDGNFITLLCDVTKVTDPDAGVYAITGICSSKNYNVTFINGTYTIERAEISVPVIASKNYTGGILTADVPENPMYDVLRNYGGINAGSYVVRLYLKSEYTKNYKWTDTEEYYIDLEFRINKSENEWTTPFEMDWVLNADATTLNANVPESKFGTPVVKFYTDASCAAGTEISESDILANKAQGRTYYVRVTVEDTANYSGLTFEKSIVIVGDRSLALNWEAFDATYDGTEHKPKAYVTIDGQKVYLVVTVNSADGKAIHAGEYTATATFKAENGTNLSGYKLYEGAPSADKTIAFSIAQRKVVVEIGDIGNIEYGTVTINVDMIVARSIVEGSVVAGDNLDLFFRGTFTEVNGFVNAGSYAIVGECRNPDYDVQFIGSWNGNDELKGKAGTYTVDKTTLSVNKSGSDWFDEDKVIDRNQAAFITLGEKNGETGEYKNISLKGNKQGGLIITYSGRAYEYDG